MPMNRGFTIIEVLVVVGAIAILTTLVAFGADALVDRAYNSEARSMLFAVKNGLEKYYSNNNEYPSAASLAGGGDGRNLSDAQYAAIAATLGMSAGTLKTANYKFVPCSVSGSPCTMTDSGDRRHIVYMTKTPSDIASNVARTYVAPSSGCTYTLPVPTVTSEAGYATYYLAYRDPTDTNWWTVWKVYSSEKGPHSRGDWCAINIY